MGLDREAVETRMIERSRKDLEFLNAAADEAGHLRSGPPSTPPPP
jgi:hypothetical protein